MCVVRRMDRGTWSHASRREYNLMDAVSRSTTQVPKHFVYILNIKSS